MTLRLARRPMPAPRTRYAATATCTSPTRCSATGPADLLFIPSWVSQMEQLWTSRGCAEMFERMTSFARLILFDRRGSGMSDRVAAGAARGADRRRARGAARGRLASGRPCWAETEGTAMACLFAATPPGARHVARAVHADPAHRRRADYPWAPTRTSATTLIEAPSSGWGDGAYVDASRRASSTTPQFREWFGAPRAARGAPGAGRPMRARIGETRRARHPAADPRPDAGDAPPRRRAGSTAATREYVLDNVPGARSSSCRAPTQLLFARRHRAGGRRDRGVRHRHRAAPTRRARARHRPVHRHRRLDRAGVPSSATARWRELLDGHDALVRAQLAALRRPRGQDDWATASSPPSTAPRARSAARSRSPSASRERRPRRARGRPHRRVRASPASDVGGIAVHIASRVLARRAPGEVLVSRTVSTWWRARGCVRSRGPARAARASPASGSCSRRPISRAERSPRARPRPASAGRAGPRRRPSSPPAGPPRSRRCARGRRPPSRSRRGGTSASARRRASVAPSSPRAGPGDLEARVACANGSGSQTRREDRPGARHQHAVADSDRAREADRALERRVRGRPRSLSHRGTTSPSAPSSDSMWMCLVSWNASSPSCPSSRPRPDCLKPPNGPASLSVSGSLNQTVPALISRMQRKIVLRSRV